MNVIFFGLPYFVKPMLWRTIAETRLHDCIFFICCFRTFKLQNAPPHMRPIKLKPDNDVSLNVKRSPFIYSPIQSNTARQKTPGSVLGKFLERKANSQKASCDLQYVVSDAKLFPLQISSGPWEMCVKFL